MSTHTYLGNPSSNVVVEILNRHLPDGLSFHNTAIFQSVETPDEGVSAWARINSKSIDIQDLYDFNWPEYYLQDNVFQHIDKIYIDKIDSFTNDSYLENIGLRTFYAGEDDYRTIDIFVTPATFQKAMMNTQNLFSYYTDEYEIPPSTLTFNFSDPDHPNKRIHSTMMRQAIEVNHMFCFNFVNAEQFGEYTPMHVQCSDKLLNYAIFPESTTPVLED